MSKKTKNSKNGGNPLLRAVLLGAISGMRSASGVALVARRAARDGDRSRLKGTLLGVWTRPSIARLAMLAAVGEVFADKLPFLPNRIDPLPLLGRAQMGALTGAAGYIEAKRPWAVGALAGALSAVASAFLFYNVRVGAVRALKLPDPAVAMAEDALVVGLGAVSERLA